MSFLFPSPTITFDAALRDLVRGKPAARVAAARALSDLGDATERARAVPALIAALDDDRGDVRAEACSSLGTLDDATAVAPIVKRLGDGDAGVRQHAAIALGTLRHPDGFVALAEALRSGPPDLRFQAATSIAEVDPVAAYEPLVAALTDSDPQVLAAIAISLGALGDGRAVGHLVRLTEHANPQVRFDAAYALAELGDTRGREILRDGLTQADRGWDAVIALERLGTSEDAAAIATMFGKRGIAPEAEIRGAGAITRMPADDATMAATRAQLTAASTARKLHLRGLAIEEIARSKAPWAIAELQTLRTHRRGREFLDVIDQALAQQS